MWFSRYIVPDREGAECTHLLMTGGRLRVTDASHADFLNEYANAVARGDLASIVERRTDVFRLFFDLDVHTSDAQRDAHEAALRGCVLSIAAMARDWFVVRDDIRATLLRKNAESSDKIGAHLVFETVYVTAPTALAFRDHVVARLADAAPEIDWAEIVDASVFKGSGLRLPWAPKRDGSSWYVPRERVVTPMGGGDPEVTSVEVPAMDPPAPVAREWIRQTCIRAPDETATALVKEAHAAVSSSTASATPSAPGESKHVPLRECADALAKMPVPPVYEPQKITSVHRVGDHAVVLRSSSKKCANKGYEEHRSSNVYFVVLRRGVAYQRCYCRKDAGERLSDQPCSRFASASWAVPDEVVRAFFGPGSEDAGESAPEPGEPRAAKTDALVPPSVFVLPSQRKKVTLDSLLARALPAKKKNLKGGRGPR